MSIGFSAGLRALLSAQSVMDVIGHNLANQNTPGYSRQIALLQTSKPVTGHGLMQIGTGVDLVDIYSVVNESLLARIRTEVSHAGQYSAEASLYDQVESLLGDLTGNGVAAKLQSLFDSATAAGTAPEDMVLRQSLLGAADELALTFHQRSFGLAGLRTSSLAEAQTIVTTANQLLEQVANLNGKIKTQISIGSSAHDLKDQRSVQLEQLAELIGADAMMLEDATGNVSVNGTTLVSGSTAAKLEAVLDGTGGIAIQTVNGGLRVKPTGGQLGGLLNLVEEFLPGRLADLDNMAKNLIFEMNRVHSKGVPGSGPFSKLSSQYAISVPQGVNPMNVPLGSSGLPFDLQAGTLSIAVTDSSTGDVERHDINVNPVNGTVGDFLESVNAIPELTAFIDGVGKLHIKASTGHGFDFSKRLDPNPVEGGTFGAGNATIVTDNFPATLSNGSQLTVAVDGGAPQTVTFNAVDFADIANASAAEVAAVFNAQAVGMTASVVDGRLVLSSATAGQGSTLAMADGVGAPAAALNLPLSATGTDVPVEVTVSGLGVSNESQQLTFKASGDGQIGVTPDLEVEVFDASGSLLATLSVGEGYEPGSPLEVIEGVFVEFSPGTIEGSAGQFFQLDTPGDTDTSNVLAAFGLNAFWKGVDAETIDVSDYLAGNPALIAGASHGGIGDGGNFLNMASLSDYSMSGLGNESITGFYNAFAAKIGTASAGATSSLQSSALVLLTLETQRAVESGVSPDEELLALQRFQNAYEAAAKYLSVLSELDDVLLQL